MSVKQDRTAPRTATDLERKYSFGKAFSEILGLIDDARKDVDAVESTLRDEIISQSTSIRRDTESIVLEAQKTIEKNIESVEGELRTEIINESAAIKLYSDNIVHEVEKSIEKNIESVEGELRTEITNQSTAMKQYSDSILLEVEKSIETTEQGLKNEIVNQSADIKLYSDEIVLGARKSIESELESIKKEVEAKVDTDGLSLAIRSEVSGGIELETGYTFDANGLRIHKSGEEMDNTLDNTGMYVKRGDEAVLIANKDGVEALDLHAKTFLKIGSGDGRSRFEDYDTNRIGCFWTGG